jgi:hypothetical protein
MAYRLRSVIKPRKWLISRSILTNQTSTVVVLLGLEMTPKALLDQQ